MGLLPTIPGNGPSGYSLDDYTAIRESCERLIASATKGELAGTIAIEVHRYSVFDLQVICGRLHHEVERLPSPYRESVRPFFIEQLFGTHHRLMLMFRSGSFRKLDDPLSDRSLFSEYLRMVPEACFSREIRSDYVPGFNSPYQGFFYFLMAAFLMFVLDEPGHPSGMPFPGGFRVEERDGVYYCPVRDKEKEVRYSICNFCPAKQSEIC
ncbi:MAG: DUF2115 domain-containing protein [Methanoregulaceae archaeon]|jgi:uncharacterized protein (UPF0305 family)|nr:DUF2115 domain-containing protein [Methanoregulaceae archaeon]